MALDNTQVNNTEANPDTGAQNIPQSNEGNNNTQPQVTNEGKTYSQKQYDDSMAATRGAAERDTKKKLLAMLGLKADEEDKLEAFKTAYENSLSEEDKKNVEMQNLQSENIKLAKDVEEKDYVIQALIELTGKNESDVEKIVKMAKGLKTEENTINDAIKEVISMISVEKPATNVVTTPTEVNPNMPTGSEITQPTTVNIDTTENPFKAGSINLTKQGQLLKTNPELARKLAAEAGVNLKF